MNTNELTLGLLPYGVVYMIDRALTLSEKRRDLQNIKSLHFNTVVVWPAVSRWDGNPPGQTAFKSIDEALDICQELGLKVIVELQGQNTSNQEAPECFGLTENRTDLNNPNYQVLTRRYIREVAEHYKGHPALLAYDIYNEIGFHGKDPHTIREFVEFLRLKYQDDIQALNTAWGTFFSDFDSILRMTPAYNAHYDLWYSAVPQLDWLRFRSHNWARRLDEWSAVIREIDPDTPILADVLGNDTLHSRSGENYGATDWMVARHTDVLGLSCWANMLGPRWREQDAFRWPQFWRASLSAGRGKQVIISEMMTPNRTMFPVEGSSMTDQIRLWSYQAIFHGLKGLIYWQYRPFRQGLQVAGRGLCNLAGEPNEHAAQAAEVAAFVEAHVDELAKAVPDHAGCALLHDPNAQDLYSTIHTSDFYLEAHAGMFKGFWHYGISPAYLIPEELTHGVPDWVRVLAVPCNVSVSQTTAQALIDFLNRGGFLLTESRFGLLNENGVLWPVVPGAGLSANFHERAFTCLFNDVIEVGDNTLTLKDDYYQYLDLGPAASVVLRTCSGEPAIIESRFGVGRHLHIPLIISHKINQDAPGALAVFHHLIELVRPALRPAIPVVAKDPLVDVSILLDQASNPLLIGITNFEYKTCTVRLRWNVQPRKIEGDEKAVAVLDKDDLLITVSPRRAAAVFVEAPSH